MMAQPGTDLQRDCKLTLEVIEGLTYGVGLVTERSAKLSNTSMSARSVATPVKTWRWA
jgi:hypothetical protein